MNTDINEKGAHELASQILALANNPDKPIKGTVILAAFVDCLLSGVYSLSKHSKEDESYLSMVFIEDIKEDILLAIARGVADRKMNVGEDWE